MDDKVEVARLRGRCLMIQDKIIAIQQECEEICLQSDAPDYRALYFKLFARTEEVPSRFMRKIVCRLRLSEVSRQ